MTKQSDVLAIFEERHFVSCPFSKLTFPFSLWTCDIDRPTELWEQTPDSLHVIEKCYGAPHEQYGFNQKQDVYLKSHKNKKKTEKPTLDVETDHLPQTHLC